MSCRSWWTQALNCAINLLLPTVAQRSLNKGRGQRSLLDRACYCCCAFISCVTGQDRVLHYLGRAPRAAAAPPPRSGKGADEEPEPVVARQPHAAAAAAAEAEAEAKADAPLRAGAGDGDDDDAGGGGGGGGGVSDATLERVLLESSRPAFAWTDQYVIVVLNFCWVCFFSVVFPWGPACALLNNLVELRADTYRMVRVSTRPVPRQVGGIGTWRAVMGFVVAMAVFVNMAIYILPLRGLYVRSLATTART